MKITIVTVGKIKEKFYREAIAEYSKRLSRYCVLEIRETEDEGTPEHASPAQEEQIKAKEAQRILKQIRPESYCITLEIQGKKMDSVAFSEKLQGLGLHGESDITFVIGGSLGLHSSVSQRSNEAFSFSDMTFPHQLMRVILLEQIYRAFKISSHEPYHK